MKLTREELMSAVASIVGDRTDDEAITFVENVSDTFDSDSSAELESAKATIDELTKKVTDTESAWRKKYMDRFYGGTDEEANPSNQSNTEEEEEEETTLDGEEITIDDLFKQKGE